MGVGIKASEESIQAREDLATFWKPPVQVDRRPQMSWLSSDESRPASGSSLKVTGCARQTGPGVPKIKLDPRADREATEKGRRQRGIPALLGTGKDPV